MIQRLSIFFSLCLIAATVQAQQPHNAEVTIAHRGIDSLKDDVSSLLTLATEKEQRQEETLLGFIGLIELGIDPQRPIRVDILTGFSSPVYVLQVGYVGEPGAPDPAADIIDNVGTNYFMKEIGNDLWEVLPPDAGWFRLIRQQKTAILILTDKSNHQLLKQYILKIADPLPEAAKMLKDGANVAARIQNQAQTDDDQDKRRANYQETKALQLDALQKRPSETKTQFALRKGLVSNQLLEIERILTEAAEANTVVGFDPQTFKATIDFDATAIVGSSFEKTLQEFGQTPDQFASIEKPEGSVFSLRANHPVDQLRQENLNRTMTLIQADATDRLSRNTEISDDVRKAANLLIEGCLLVARDTVAGGNLNGFWEKLPAAEGEFTGYGAVAVKDGERLVGILENVAETGSGNSIKVSIDKVGDVSIHEVKFKKGFFGVFDLLFDGKVGYIGTSQDHVWFATGGEVGLAPLKAAIGSLKEPAENDVILTMDGNLLPLIEQTIRVVEKLEEPKTASLKVARRDYLSHLKIAAESLQTEDEASFRMDVANGKATGLIKFDTGTLRFVARMMATFSKNNLE